MSSPNLSGPTQRQIDDAWEALVDFDFFNRFGGEIKAESPNLAEQFADYTLDQMGTQRLTSPLFWTFYEAALDQGLPAHEAIQAAHDLTPEFG